MFDDENDKKKENQEEPKIDPQWMDHLAKGGKIGKSRESEEEDDNS